MRRRATWAIGVVMLALGGAGCGDSPSTPTGPPGPFTITGLVSDLKSAEPAPSVSLLVGAASVTTDLTGRYSVSLPRGEHQVRLASTGEALGTLSASSDATRGDLFVNGGQCAVRYGMVSDAVTGQPVPDANVSNRTRTDAAGWYRLDYYDGLCDGTCGSCNTIYIGATKEAYEATSVLLGRGVRGVERLDLILQPR